MEDIEKTLAKMSNENIDIAKTYKNYENIKKTIDACLILILAIANRPIFSILYESKIK